jgi:hypothetical protein
MLNQQAIALPLQQIDSKEVSAARMPGATIIRHGKYRGHLHTAQCASLIDALRQLVTLFFNQGFYRSDARLLHGSSNCNAIGTSLGYLTRIHRACDG